VPLRRFRWRVQNGVGAGTISDEGIYYATSYEPVGPNGEEMRVTCADGFVLLSLDNLETLEPPDATSYEEVINFDDPAFYYRLGEPEGTKMVAHVRKVGRKGHKRKKRWKTVETAAPLGGVSGPAGTYVGTPTLGEPGAIRGDPDTCVKFESAGNERAIVQVDQSDLIDTNRLSISLWVKASTTNNLICLAGPTQTGLGLPVFYLYVDGNGPLNFILQFTDGLSGQAIGTTNLSTNTWFHVGASWDGQKIRVYLNGVLDGEGSYSGKVLRQGSAGQYLMIGGTTSGAGGPYFDGWLDEVAIFEKALAPDRFLAHYTAGTARGRASELAWQRFEALTDNPLWTPVSYGGSMQVQPTMFYGQSVLDEIREIVAAEQPHSHFFFSGDGTPTYLGWEDKATGSYMISQAIFGNGAGEVRYEDLELVYNDELYNEVTVSRDGGEGQTATDTSSQASYKRRTLDETGLILSEDEDANTIANALLDSYAAPEWRIPSLTLSGVDSSARTQILTRQIGELIRVKHRPKDGTAIDRMTHILGYSKRLDAGSGNLSCTWNLARGFNAGQQVWRLGVSGFSELGTTAVLG
jgi:hypothetical protein